MKKPTLEEIRRLVHTPADMGVAFVQWAERIQAAEGIPFGIPALDKRVIPMRPGDMVGFVARPGNGKSSMMAYLARREAARIVKNGKQHEEAVVYATWETSVEELESMIQADDRCSSSDIAWGRVDLDIVRGKAVKRAVLPIWAFGHGMSRAGQKMARMTPEIVLDAVESMQQDFGVKPTLMLFDYLQLIPVSNARDRVQQVTEAPIRIKEVALRIGVPAVIGIQAGRSVDQKRVKIPEMADCQWGSAIEQAADKLFALWKPSTSQAPGSLVEVEGETYTVDDNLLIMRMLKQRGERGRHTWALYFQPQYMKLAELETREDMLF